MLKILFILYLFPMSSFGKEHATIEAYHSESTTYLHFLAAGFGEPHTSGSMKGVIKKNNIDKFSDKKNLKRYEVLKSYLVNGYNFNTINTRPASFYGEDAYQALSVLNPKPEEFEKNLSILMPYDGVTAYFELKKELYSSFKDKIWTPTLVFQKKEIESINKTIKETNFSKILLKVKKFYKSSYPLEIPFKIGLVPIDDKGIKDGHTSATSLKNIQIVPYLITRGSSDNMDVVFHELCHALYEGQDQKVKKEIEDFYLNSADSHATFVYRYLNESIATALGNGYYREILDGKISKDSWYNVEYINGLAKAYYSLVKSYIEQDKEIDKSFFKKTLKIAKKIYPDGPFSVDSNMMALNILSNNNKVDVKAISNELRKNFRVSSINWSSSITKEDFTKLNNPGTSNIVLISSKANDILNESKLGLSEPKLTKIQKSNYFFATFKLKGKYIFWANIKDEKMFTKIIGRLSSKKKLSPEFEIINL